MKELISDRQGERPDPLDEDERFQWAALQAYEVLELASNVQLQMQRGDITERTLRDMWAAIGLAFEAGRLNPRPLTGD